MPVAAPPSAKTARLLFLDNLRIVLVAVAYGLHYVALYPLLKWGIAVLICTPLCFLMSGWIRKIPLVARVV